MNLFELSAKLSLDSSAYMSGINTAKKAVGAFGKVAAATFAAGSAAFVAFSKSAVQTGAEFDTAMSQVAATMGVTTDEIANLRDFAKQMGATTKFSATQSAQALNYMALAGYDAEKSMETLPTVLNLAAAGGMDLARASDMVTDAESALGLTSKQTAKMVDQMATAASNSNTSVEQLGDAMLTIGGTAKIMAGGTDRLQTVLGLLADNGIKGAEAGTHLRNMLLKLSAPTKDGSDTLHALGVEVFDASGNMRDMQDIILDLGTAMSGLTDEQKVKAISDIFNARDLSAVNALLGTSKDRWDELGSAIASAQGSAQKMADTQLDNLTGNVTIMKSAWEGLKIEFSEGLMPTLNEIVKKITGWLSKPKTMKFVKDLGTSAGKLVNKIFDWIKKVFPKVRDVVKNLWPVFKGVFGNVGGIVSKVVGGMSKAFENAIPKIGNMIGKVADIFNKIAPKINKFIRDISPALKTIFDTISSLVKKALPVVVKLVEKLTPLISSIVKFISNIVKTVGPLLERLLEFVGTVLGDIIDDVSAFVKSWGPAISSAIKVIAEVLKPVLSVLQEIHKVTNVILAPVKLLVNEFGSLVSGYEKLSYDIDESQYQIEHVVKVFSNLSEEYQNNASSALEAAKAYGELNKEYSKSYAESENEIKHIQDLYKELDKLVDSEGRVNEKNLDRAKFITEELGSLTGQEIEWNGNVIESYKNIAGAIDDIIERKRASALLDIAEQKAQTARDSLDETSEAIYNKQFELEGFFAAAEKYSAEADKQLANWAEKQAKVDELLAERDSIEEMLASGNIYVGTTEYEELERRQAELIDEIKQKKADAASAKALYNDAVKDVNDANEKITQTRSELDTLRGAEVEYYRDVSRYEAAYLAYAQGDFAEVQALLEGNVKYYKDYVLKKQEISQEELNLMKHDMDVALAEYSRYKENYLNNQEGYDQEGLNKAKEAAQEMTNIYRLAAVNGRSELLEQGRLLGINLTSGFENGIASMAKKLAQAAANAAQGAVRSMKNTLQIKSPSKVTEKIGQYFGEGFSEGILDEVKAVEDSVGYMSDSAVDAFGNPASEKYDHGTTGHRASSMSRVEQLLQSILDNMGVDIVLEDGTIAGRVDRILGKTAMRKARGGA